MTQDDLLNLSDDGDAQFDVTEVETGEAIDYDGLTKVAIGSAEKDVNERFAYRCRKCGSSNCRLVNDVRMGSSWTGLYGSMDLKCSDCDAYRTLWMP